METKFHEGELKIQQKTGESYTANANRELILNSVFKGAFVFIERQINVLCSTIDSELQVWVSLVTGTPGFVEVVNPYLISIDLNLVTSDTQDLLYSNISEQSPIGILFIEFSTRRRYRVNGISSINKQTIDINVEEAYPNCPKYIQQRIAHNEDVSIKPGSERTTGKYFNEQVKNMLLKADTLFIGSQSKEGRMDVSHRGGKPGFVELIDNENIRIPDYKGNSLFNTWGNLLQNVNSGLLFIDFEKRIVLQMTGKSELLLNQNSQVDMDKSGGTGRFLAFKVSSWIITTNQHSINWELIDYSHFNP